MHMAFFVVVVSNVHTKFVLDQPRSYWEMQTPSFRSSVCCCYLEICQDHWSWYRTVNQWRLSTWTVWKVNHHHFWLWLNTWFIAKMDCSWMLSWLPGPLKWEGCTELVTCSYSSLLKVMKSTTVMWFLCFQFPVQCYTFCVLGYVSFFLLLFFLLFLCIKHKECGKHWNRWLTDRCVAWHL